MSDRLLNVIKICISLALLAVLIWVLDVEASLQALRQIDLGYFAIAFLLYQLTLMIRAKRWGSLLEAVSIEVPYHRLLYLYYVGTFFNTFLPSAFGGDAIKMFELGRYTQRVSESVGTVLVDRVAGLAALCAMGLVVLPFAYPLLPQGTALIALAASGGVVVATWLLFQERLAEIFFSWMPGAVRKKLEEVYDAVHSCGRGAIWQAMLISLAFNLILFTATYCLALALDVRISYLYFVAFMPVISLSMMIPSVGALGTREGAYVLMFGSAGVSEPIAFAMSLSFYIIEVLTGLIGAGLYAVNAVRGLHSEPRAG